jgi:hypothetical protein
MSGPSIGEVRPSQVITTFGPGSIVDLESLSIIVASTASWRESDAPVIREHRLERALGVERFLAATARNQRRVPVISMTWVGGTTTFRALSGRGSAACCLLFV